MNASDVSFGAVDADSELSFGAPLVRLTFGLVEMGRTSIRLTSSVLMLERPLS